MAGVNSEESRRRARLAMVDDVANEATENNGCKRQKLCATGFIDGSQFGSIIFNGPAKVNITNIYTANRPPKQGDGSRSDDDGDSQFRDDSGNTHIHVNNSGNDSFGPGGGGGIKAAKAMPATTAQTIPNGVTAADLVALARIFADGVESASSASDEADLK